MKREMLGLLQCPQCKKALSLIETEVKNGEIKEGSLSCCGKSYRISNYILRFIDSDKYVGSFSFEWRIHSKTQLDSANSGSTMQRQSEKDFQGRVDFVLSELKDKLVLDVGCGMGRFSEVVVGNKANLIGIDLSYAVDVARENIDNKKNADFIQADIFNLPFKEGIFDFVYSFGVLHHTPDCKAAFAQISRLVKSGGKLSIFVYSSYNKGIVYTSNFWRFFTTRMPKRLLYLFSFIAVPLYYLYRIPVLGSIAKMLFVIPMWPNWRWRVLDTFDWYSPKYQSKHTHWEVYKWFMDNGYKDIVIFENEITMMGTKK